MLVYTVILLLTIFGCFIKDKKTRNIYSFFLILLMIIIVGYRSDDIGSDTQRYLYRFKSGYNELTTEILFSGILMVLRYLNLSPPAIQFSFCLITFVPLSIILYKWSKNVCFSLLCMMIMSNMYFYETMNLVRQMCAVSYLLVAFYYIKEKKLILSLIFFLISVGFHTSCVFLLPFIILGYFFHPSPKLFCILLFGSLVIGISISSVSYFAEKIKLLNEISFLSISDYSYIATYQSNVHRNFIGILSLTLPSTFVAYFIYKISPKDVIVRIYSLAVIVNNMIAVLPTGQRMLLGILFLEIILIPQIYYSMKKYRYVIIAFIIFLIFFNHFYRLPVNPSTTSNWFVPYSNYLFQ